MLLPLDYVFIVYWRRYGHFKVCRLIIPELTEEVSSEHLHFWLQGLVEISAGESALASEEVPLLDRLGIAISHYNTAISSLKVTYDYTLFFNLMKFHK